MANLGRSQTLVAEKEIRDKITNWTRIFPITYKRFSKVELPKLLGLEGPLTAVNTANDCESDLRLFDKKGREARISLLDREDDDFDLAQIISAAEQRFYKVSNNSKLLLVMEERIFLSYIIEKVYFSSGHPLEITWDVPISGAKSHWIRLSVAIPAANYNLLRGLEGEICAILHNHARSTDYKNILSLYRILNPIFLELGRTSVQISYEENSERKNFISATDSVNRYQITDNSGCYVRTDEGNWHYMSADQKICVSFSSEEQNFSFNFSNITGEQINSINLASLTDKALETIAKELLPAFSK